MKKQGRFKRALRAVNNFFFFFLPVAFVITCCLMLFVSTLQNTLGFEFTREQITAAAKVTLLNVILITFIFTVIDYIRRKLTVDRPVKNITEAAAKMVKGDFSVRIKTQSRFATDEKFGEIIDCINGMAEELEGVETLRTDFISNVSHEMKTPLAVIANYSTLLQSPDLPDKQRIEYAKAIGNTSRRLSEMMTNILKLNRLENQKIYQKSAPCDLEQLLCDCILQYETVWEEKDIELQTHIKEGLFVLADGELLCLVLNNLLSNAFKFTDPGGKVTVSTFADGEYAVIRIEDTGCGMTPEVGAHIFEKFYQGDPSRATQGNGLGLALVKRVVDILEGAILVESTPHVGSAFTIRIRSAENGLQEDL